MLFLSNISPRVLGHVNVFFSAVFYNFLARSQWGRFFFVRGGFQVCFPTTVVVFLLGAGGLRSMELVFMDGSDTAYISKSQIYLLSASVALQKTLPP